MDLPSLKGKRALVTASSKGLGRAVAAELAAQGADVVISSRDEKNLKNSKQEIISDCKHANKKNIYTKECNLRISSDIEELIQYSVEALDGLDILVTNHGGTRRETFENISADDLDGGYELALRSTYLTIKEAMPALKRSSGTILNIVSASAQEPPDNHVISNIFRLGIYGLSKSLANEYGNSGIRVNCVAPRMIYTERIQSIVRNEAERNDSITPEDALNSRVETLPLGRVGDTKEFAQAIAFLASDAASYVTGTTLPVDGGWSRSVF